MGLDVTISILSWPVRARVIVSLEETKRGAGNVRRYTGIIKGGIKGPNASGTISAQMSSKNGIQI